MAADHFVRRGHRAFAFVAFDGRQFSMLRYKGFADRLAELKRGVVLLKSADGLRGALSRRPRTCRWR